MPRIRARLINWSLYVKEAPEVLQGINEIPEWLPVRQTLSNTISMSKCKKDVTLVC